MHPGKGARTSRTSCPSALGEVESKLASTVPMSQAGPWGLGIPRWSVGGFWFRFASLFPDSESYIAVKDLLLSHAPR